ncbi:hypothetical protein BVRB_6g139340 [Beta vulgaris subsp. vulgaris]|nr:hypothetical protein BVRB_6g139340 [Beta vulgaris subsp. vulgaris]
MKVEVEEEGEATVKDSEDEEEGEAAIKDKEYEDEDGGELCFAVGGGCGRGF